MKKLALLLIFVLLLTSCDAPTEYKEEHDYDYYAINMKTDFPVNDTLPMGEGKRARVIFLLGQSNATGASLTSYLKKAVTEEQYAEFEEGYENVKINFSVDNQTSTSGGAFVKTTLDLGVREGYFGPEVGMAEVLSGAMPDEEIFILKFTMSGYSLNHHWLYAYERASIYKAFLIFANTYLSYLEQKEYEVSVDAICWMQGESDATKMKAGRYLENTRRFVCYLRSDFSQYANPEGIYFIDAGISDCQYWEEYKAINEAKRAFAESSPLNIYFSTIDLGLTTLNEPTENPDIAHYDAESELELGRMFGRELLKIYNS